MSKRNTDWVVYDLKNTTLRCDRCNQTVPLSLPMPLTIVCRFMNVFLKHHKRCKPLEEPAKEPAKADVP